MDIFGAIATLLAPLIGICGWKFLARRKTIYQLSLSANEHLLSLQKNIHALRNPIRYYAVPDNSEKGRYEAYVKELQKDTEPLNKDLNKLDTIMLKFKAIGRTDIDELYENVRRDIKELNVMLSDHLEERNPDNYKPTSIYDDYEEPKPKEYEFGGLQSDEFGKKVNSNINAVKNKLNKIIKFWM